MQKQNIQSLRGAASDGPLGGVKTRTMHTTSSELMLAVAPVTSERCLEPNVRKAALYFRVSEEEEKKKKKNTVFLLFEAAFTL